MSKPGIFLVSNLYPSENAPHFGVFVKNFEQGMRKQGHAFDHFKFIRYLIFYLRIIFLGLFGKYDLMYVHFISHAALPVLIAHVFRRKTLVVNAHGSDVLASGVFQKQLGFITKKMLNRADLIVVPSGYFQKVVSEKFVIDPKKIFVSPSGGINDTVFQPMRKFEVKEKLQVEGHSVLGFVSRIDEGKGWDDLLKALRIIIDRRSIQSPLLLAAGTGEQRQAFEKLVKELGLEKEVSYKGLVGHKDLVELYNAMDVFVFPSKREAESLGLVGLEAMACGVPVIGAETGGVVDYLHAGLNGLIVKPNDPESLADGIEKFFKLPKERRNEMANHALLTAQEYYGYQVAERLSNKLCELQKAN
jgi:glycosyltransferase involved in cell wall biosynthesis